MSHNKTKFYKLTLRYTHGSVINTYVSKLKQEVFNSQLFVQTGKPHIEPLCT